MSEAATPTCSKCGAPVPASLRFCPGCGAPAGPEAGQLDSTQRLHATPAPGEAPEPAAPVGPDSATSSPVPAPVRSGLVLDWDPELVAVVSEAAKIKGTTVGRMIRALVEPEARKVVLTRRGLMSLAAAAEHLGVAKSEVIAMISSGELKARKIDDEWMIEKASLGGPGMKAGDEAAQTELDLRQLVQASGLQGLETEGAVSDSVSTTLCYVNQEGVLVCPRSVWRRLGRAQVVAEARDAVRRYLRRRDRDAGRI